MEGEFNNGSIERGLLNISAMFHFTGEFKGGQPYKGEMRYSDNRVFEGLIEGNEPFDGEMRSPDGTTTQFKNGAEVSENHTDPRSFEEVLANLTPNQTAIMEQCERSCSRSGGPSYYGDIEAVRRDCAATAADFAAQGLLFDQIDCFNDRRSGLDPSDYHDPQMCTLLCVMESGELEELIAAMFAEAQPE